MIDNDKILKFKPMIYKIINKHKYNSRLQDENDLVQLGYIGVINAYNTYDVNKNDNFNNYVYNCIKWSIQRGLRHDIKAKDYKIISLDKPIENNSADDITLLDTLEDPHDDIRELEDRIMLSFYLNVFNESLTPLQNSILTCMYKDNINRTQYSEMYNTSYSIVCGAVKNAYGRLAHNKKIIDRYREVKKIELRTFIDKTNNTENKVILKDNLENERWWRRR